MSFKNIFPAFTPKKADPDFNHKNAKGYTPMHFAACACNEVMINYIFQNGGSTLLKDPQGRYPHQMVGDIQPVVESGLGEQIKQRPVPDQATKDRIKQLLLDMALWQCAGSGAGVDKIKDLIKEGAQERSFNVSQLYIIEHD